MTIFDPAKFIVPTAKPLPVIFLLDVSGSMTGTKIQNLNLAVRDMLDTFRDTETAEIAIDIAIISFGSEVKLHQALTSASGIVWHDLSAGGGTPLGTALRMTKAMVEDKNVLPSRAYRPTVVLISDGKPTDDWKQPLTDFIENGRSSKCDRMAMAIGADADESVLEQFIKGTNNPLFYAENAKQLRDFFKFITMSVTLRMQSSDKNIMPQPTIIEVKPATIEEKAKRIDNSASPQQSNDESNGGYW